MEIYWCIQIISKILLIIRMITPKIFIKIKATIYMLAVKTIIA